MNKTKTVLSYLTFDALAACSSWILFYLYNNRAGETPLPTAELTSQPDCYLPMVILPFCWILVYFITGYYDNIFRKSRLIELSQTFFTTLWGSVILFFLLVLNDKFPGHLNFLKLFLVLFSLQFGITYFFRIMQTSRITRKIHQRQFGFNTLIVGGDEKAVELFHHLNNQENPSGNLLVGYVELDPQQQSPLKQHLPYLGGMAEIPSVIEKYKIEEVIVTIASSEHNLLSRLLILLQRFKLTVWGIPDLYDLLSGAQKTNNLYGLPLFKISNGIMPAWAMNVKRLCDVIFSAFGLLLFAPLSLAIAIAIKIDSHGPVIYAQNRVGRFGKEFRIFKFRTMVCDAEVKGPQLSSTNDPRITTVGRFLRKTHLDEIPQFINVIMGQMSLVGPRPERRYFIEQLVAKAPQYGLLHKVRPGITSWGQIKYGYASNIDQMLERLPYDLVYLKNASLYLDFKIMIYSTLELFSAKGK
ncbi:sugar transferase [Mangrovibacterium marinum]|uniref:Exopolysaccharide biosynthesis polyprenyl glycosylphosphotransferase n=1 Tax=Mangrovibacterium marinum TaxID=1639118 RepID=A0A2T5C192_9BACT|nr:sugar transferase [Mangrovibacterium marinum]PTN08387.1 exopolysaccharide biosynthesis polyprenyl glycosylphosphotransferase [Mangrovibacterium marinum]